MTAAASIPSRLDPSPESAAEPASGRTPVRPAQAPYERQFQVIWADIDQNGHLRHTAYLDYATQARISCFTDSGFGFPEFEEHRCAPILTRETAHYLREVRPGQMICVRVTLSGRSADDKRFAMRSTVLRADGETAAIIDVEGAWMDLTRRKLRPAPPRLAHAMARMPLTGNAPEGFAETPATA